MTASGIIAEAKDRLRNMLANCTAFRTWDGAAYSEAQALARIYLDALPAPGSNAQEYTAAELATLRPYAVIYNPPENGVSLRYVATGSSARRFLPSGTLLVKLVRTIPADDLDDPATIVQDFENMVGPLMQSGDSGSPGLVELSGREGYLPILSINESGAWRCGPEDVPARGEYQEYWLEIEWGTP